MVVVRSSIPLLWPRAPSTRTTILGRSVRCGHCWNFCLLKLPPMLALHSMSLMDCSVTAVFDGSLPCCSITSILVRDTCPGCWWRMFVSSKELFDLMKRSGGVLFGTMDKVVVLPPLLLLPLVAFPSSCAGVILLFRGGVCVSLVVVVVVVDRCCRVDRCCCC